MIANSPAPVAAAFSNSSRPTSPGESVWAAIPEPITRAARNAEPTILREQPPRQWLAHGPSAVRRGAGRRSRHVAVSSFRRTRRAARPRGPRRRRPLRHTRTRSMLSSTAAGGRPEHGEGRPRICILGLAHRAAVDEQHPAVLADPRFVGMAEDEHAIALGGGEALIQTVAGLSSKRYSLTLRGEPCTRWTSAPPTGSAGRTAGRT